MAERLQNPYNPALRRLFGGQSEFPIGLEPAPPGPSQPGALGTNRVPIALPGNNYSPAGATPVDEIGDANIAPGGTATLVTINVPETLRFRMAGIGFGADDEVALRFLRWSVTANTNSLPGYALVPAGIGSIRQLATIELTIGSTSQVTVVAQADAGAVLTYRYIARVRGWFYLETEERG